MGVVREAVFLRHATTVGISNSQEKSMELEQKPLVLEAGKKYVTRAGGVVMVLGPSDDPVHPFLVFEYETGQTDTYTADGTFSVFGDSPYLDLIAEYVEPVKHVRYFNIYSHNELHGRGYCSREKADATADKSKRTGCIRVEWTDGQFDD